MEADGFLYNMVRIMVGSLLDVQTGQRRDTQILEALNTATGLWLFYRAAHGLFLEEVFYPEGVFEWPKSRT